MIKNTTKSANPCKALLFDLDGTLVDTAADFVKIINEQRSDYNLPPIEDTVIRNTVSDGARAMTALAFGGQPGETLFEKRKQELLERYETSVGDAARLFPGMESVIEHCLTMQLPWGIITNKPRLYTELLLKKLTLNSENLFNLSNVTLCPDDVKNAKPDPESLLLAASILNINPQDCIYVGDHLRDIQAGEAANMTTVAAKYGYISKNINIEKWNADHYVDNPIDLLSLFRI